MTYTFEDLQSQLKYQESYWVTEQVKTYKKQSDAIKFAQRFQ